jgi:hypothetical protein
MAGDLALIARLLAYREGRAFPRASHLQVAVQPDAYVVCPLAMAGEDTTVHIVAYGRIGEEPSILCTPEPRKRDDQYLLFEALGADLERYFDQRRRAGSYPQLWVSSSAAVGHLDTLADRLRYNRENPNVRRFGELLSYATGRVPLAGQQALLATTSVLKQHWATGQQEGEDEHLGALLTWLEPPAGQGIQGAVAAAELQPMSVKTDPDFDRDVLEPLVRAYNRAVRSGEPKASQDHHAARIREVLEPVVLPIYAATQRAIAILQGRGLPPLPDLAELEAHEAAEFAYFMDGRDQGIPLSLRDAPRAAAFGLEGREKTQQNADAAVLLGDRVARATARLAGRVIVGEVENPRQVCAGARQVVSVFELRSEQPVLHVRRRDELSAAHDPRLRVLVEDVYRSGTTTRLRLRMLAGQRAVGLPLAGASLELVDGMPEWNGIWRVRGHLKKALATTPWTHRTDGAPAPAPAAGPRPANLLAAVDAFR